VEINYYLYRLGGVVVPKLPPSLGYTICRLIGGLLFQLNRGGRANIEKNLRRILGPEISEAEIRRDARQTFNYILYNYFDLFRLPGLDDRAVEQLVTVKGWDNVEAALAEGRGIVMTSAHLGNIEVVLYAMLLRGLSITIPVERVSPPRLFEYISALRSTKGLSLIPIDRPLIGLMRTLKHGGVAGLAGDRDITGTGQIIDFFGYPAHLPDGHVRLALRSQAPVVVGFSRRNSDHTYEACFLPPFHLAKEGSEEERVAGGMKYVIGEIEKAIRQVPQQWTLTVSIWADD
jgi:KDO2-lipid IV(A) lauroyltransferase